MTIGPYEFKYKGQPVLNEGGGILDALQDVVLPDLKRQAGSTLEAITAERQRRAELSATRRAIRSEQQQRRDKGLG